LDEPALRLVTLTGHPSQLALLRRRQALGRRQLLTRSVAVLDRLRELDLEFLVEQLVLTNVGQVQPDEIFLVAFYSLLRQRSNPFVGTRTVWVEKRVKEYSGDFALGAPRRRRSVSL